MSPGRREALLEPEMTRKLEGGDCHSERGLTAALPGAFEARNGLFDRRPAGNGKSSETSAEGIRMVGVDNESNQVS